MALAEKHVADLIVELDNQVALGHEYCRSTDVLPVLHEALLALQASRAQIGRLGELVESLSVA